MMFVRLPAGQTFKDVIHLIGATAVGIGLLVLAVLLIAFIRVIG